MIEPFDAKRHEALLTTAPIRPINPTPDQRVHRLADRTGMPAALCRALGALLGSADWRLVDCTDCRQAGEAASA